MKNKVVILFATVLVCNSTYAQTWQEWFQQKKTQKKYLLQQIAALQVYYNYAKKGYNIASKGITSIQNIKKGDFNLHRDFIASLKTVNPKIKQYAKVADIIFLQALIIKRSKQSILDVKASKQFTLDELNHCSQVFSHLLIECVKNIDELLLVITSDKLAMNDNERITRVDKLCADMQDKYSFCLSFSDDTGLLSAQRLAGRVEINHSKIINGIK